VSGAEIVVTTALTRRQICSLATTILLGGLIGHDNHLPGREHMAANLDGLKALGNLDNLRSLGRKCVDLVPLGQQQLFEAAGLGTALEAQDQLAGFARKRQEDFLVGRTRIVSGWVLAEAECALCVLCAQA